MNGESELTMFQNRRGSSNIDLTIVNNRLLKTSMDGKLVQMTATPVTP
jgi:hypothetical protein